MNRDFAEMLAASSAAGADYLLVGAHALAAHGVVRATGDMDVWVRATPENASKVWRALLAFGAPLHQRHRTLLGRVPGRVRTPRGDFNDGWRARRPLARSASRQAF